MSYVERVTRQSASLRQQVTQRLRDAILDGRLKPGQKLYERELCELLGISRTLLREALQQLRAEGLITSVMHKGPSVAMIGAEEVSQIYEVRQALEAIAGAGFARSATDEQVRALRAQLELMKTPEAIASAKSLLLAKSGFYQVLLEGCGNAVVSQVLTQLNYRMTLFKRISLSAPGRLQEAVTELEKIVAAIEARNPQWAATLCAAHVANAAETVMRQLAAEANSPTEQEEDGRADLQQRA